MLTLPSPAKINLFLHINGRLNNGYHELQTLFHFLDYGDELSFELNDSGKINLTCNLPELESEDNLVFKAAKILQGKAKQSNGINIHLTKRLPMGGGVGGGSSNAATALLALNQLWELNIQPQALEKIGQSLGADIPIFIRGHSAFAEGIGEKLIPCTIPEYWYLVLMPNQEVNTHTLFNDPNLPRNTAKLSQTVLDNLDWQLSNARDPNSSILLKNDFQTLVCEQYPAIAKALNWLLEYAPSRMTGTGACVFAQFSTKEAATDVFNKLPKDLSGFVAKGSNVSSTHKQLNSI